MDPLITGAIIGGVSQLGAGLLNNAMSQNNAKAQRDWQEKMWNKQNEYNDPSAVASRMRRAGLNPYGELSATPAGSAGTGAVAQTIPINDPLSALKTIAEVENINASTGRIETENEKLLKEISQLDILNERGLLSNEEYKKRLELLFEEWKKANPFTVERESKQAQTAAASAAAGASDAQKSYTEALTDTENQLRDLRAGLLSAQTDTEKSKQSQLYSQTLLNNALQLKSKQDFMFAKQDHPLEQQILQYARDMNASQAQIAKYREELERIYSDPNATWDDWSKVLMNMLRDFGMDDVVDAAAKIVTKK